ncbi:MAG: hypothetical protein KDA85_02135 [Planctomycetaceae bacterium]|nr:hypothetical protein [Planctomycetaceae bacterium]
MKTLSVLVALQLATFDAPAASHRSHMLSSSLLMICEWRLDGTGTPASVLVMPLFMILQRHG